jgi:hypothetical protein
MCRIFVAITALFISTVGLSAETSFPFKVTLLGDVAMTIDGQKQAMITDSSFTYLIKRRENEVELTCNGMKVTAKMNGTLLMDSMMTHDRFYFKQADKDAVDLTRDNFNDGLKVLTDAYGSPLCTITIDENGREVKRVETSNPGADNMKQNGFIANMRMFHAPFVAAEKSWKAPGVFSMGNGGYARGELEYSKVGEPEDSPDGPRVKVKVSGILTCAEHKPPNNPLTTKNARYEVEGTQIYAVKIRDWESGELNIKISAKLNANEGAEVNGEMNGTMKARLERLPAGK